MQQFVDRGEAAGIVTLIADRSHIIHTGAVGRTDLAKARPMRTDDIFWIASMSKPVAAICVGILKDQGKLRMLRPSSTCISRSDNLL